MPSCFENYKLNISSFYGNEANAAEIIFLGDLITFQDLKRNVMLAYLPITY